MEGPTKKGYDIYQGIGVEVSRYVSLGIIERLEADIGELKKAQTNTKVLKQTTKDKDEKVRKDIAAWKKKIEMVKANIDEDIAN